MNQKKVYLDTSGSGKQKEFSLHGLSLEDLSIIRYALTVYHHGAQIDANNLTADIPHLPDAELELLYYTILVEKRALRLLELFEAFQE